MNWRDRTKPEMRKRDHARKGISKTTEFLNLKPDGSLKSQRIDKLSDEIIIRKQGSTRTGVASTVTGVVGGATLSVGLPLLATGLVISVPQMINSSINRHRVRKEVNKRKNNDDPAFAKLLDERDKTWKKIAQVGLGVGMRGGLMVATMGLVGFENVAQGFLELTHPAIESAMAPAAASAAAAAADPAINAASHTASHAGSAAHPVPHAGGDAAASNPASHGPTIHDQFKADHPHADMVDSKIHKAASGIIDKTTQAITDHTGLDFNGDTTWNQLDKIWHQADGDPKAQLAIVAQSVVEAAVAEFLTPLQMSTELGVDKARERRWNRTEERKGFEKLE